MKKYQKSIKAIVVTMLMGIVFSFTSCDVMMGMAEGMASYSYYNPYGYGTYSSYGNMSNSLNPYVVWNQAQQQVAQQQQFVNYTAQQTWNQAKDKVEKEQKALHDNIKNTRKLDGSEFTETEILEIMNNAYSEQNKTLKQSSSLSSDDSEYKGELSPVQYKETYLRYEKSVESWFNNLTNNGYKGKDSEGNITGKTVGTMLGGAYIQNKMGLLETQKDMKQIRLEAIKYGVYIQESKWETATAGY